MENKKETLVDVPYGINIKERAISKTRYPMFALYCKFIIDSYKDGNEIFYVRDIRKYGKISYASANNFFTSLHDLGFLIKKNAGNTIFFELKKDIKGEPVLLELLSYINKTLKLNGDN